MMAQGPVSDRYQRDNADAVDFVNDISDMHDTNLHTAACTKRSFFRSRVQREYIKFLKLKAHVKDFDGVLLLPSEPIDAFWHHHILRTKHYAQVCNVLAGQMIHHNPLGKQDDIARMKRYKRTLQEYVKLYQQEPPSDIWPPIPDSEASRKGISLRFSFW